MAATVDLAMLGRGPQPVGKWGTLGAPSLTMVREQGAA